MTVSKNLSFWHQTIGQYLTTPSLSPTDSPRAKIPHRTKEKGIQMMRIGAKDVFYIATPERSILIGCIEMEDTDHLHFVPSESCSARKYVAEWLLTNAVGPFMVGEIAQGDAHDSFRVSHHVTQSYYCQPGAGFFFDLELVREAQKKITNLSWKKIVAPAIHQYERMRHATDSDVVFEREKMMKLIKKTPELRQILPTLGVLPNSGEYNLLSWLNIEQEKKRID